MAKAIMLHNIEGVGQRGTVVEVSAGYLRNYLLPRKLAQAATKGALDAARERMEKLERERREASERAGKNAELLTKTVLTIQEKAGKDGRLFGSVTAGEIAAAIRAARGIRIDKRKIKLPEPIKNTGTYMVEVEVTNGVLATVKTMVVEAK